MWVVRTYALLPDYRYSIEVLSMLAVQHEYCSDDSDDGAELDHAKHAQSDTNCRYRSAEQSWMLP